MSAGNGHGGNGSVRPVRPLADFDLDAVSDPEVTMTIGGVKRRVRVFDLPRWRIWDRIKSGVNAAVEAAKRGEQVAETVTTEEFYAAVKWCLPDTPEKVVEGLSAFKGGLVLQRAAQQLEAMEEAIPNGERAATDVAASPTTPA